MKIQDILAEAPANTVGETKRKRLKLIHTTHEQQSVDKIVKQGFNLRHFGKTGKMFNAPVSLTQYDPKGVYASPYYSGENRPHLELEINANVLSNKTLYATEFKEQLFKHFSAKNSADLSKKLLKQGIQAIETESEVIILDTKVIKIKSHT